MYNTGYGYNNAASFGSPTAGAAIWGIIALILAIVGAFLVYFLFVRPEKKYSNKFLTWLREFFNFQAMLIEPIVKSSYLFTALFITLISFAAGFPGFFIVLIGGNIIARVIYELGMITISIWKNTKEINKKMK